MVGSADGDASDLRCELQWQSRTQFAIRVGGPRTRQHPVPFWSFVLMRFNPYSLFFALAIALAAPACESSGPHPKKASKAVLPPNALPTNTTGFSTSALQDAAKLF